ncbi:MAG TPA: hypothetical protein VLM75_03405 [Spirochaetota bacterium]|nr:hypothetical protein [Spirochaetota bacterium]
MGLNYLTVVEPARSLGHIPLFRDVPPSAVLRTIDSFSDVPGEALSGPARYYYTSDRYFGFIDLCKPREKCLCEPFTTPERFFEYGRPAWVSDKGCEKEFAPDILVDGISCGLIVEELNNMENSCDAVGRRCREAGNGGRVFFAIPSRWPYTEYATALMPRAGKELEKLKSAMHEITTDEDTASKGKAQGDTPYRR